MLKSTCFAYDFHTVTAPPPATRELGDIRFRSLLTSDEWQQLPAPVRKRFSKRLAGLATAVYRGEVIHTRMSTVGWCLAQLGRLIGAPLPLSRDAHMPAVVTVTEDPATGGQFWSRHYNRHNGFPQVIHSSKRFGGPTGLEEYVGGGVGMALNIHVRNGALVFTSAYYFLAIGKHRLRLPKWAAPGSLTVTHRAINDELFEFSLHVAHPLFGELVHQSAVFEEQASSSAPRIAATGHIRRNCLDTGDHIA